MAEQQKPLVLLVGGEESYTFFKALAIELGDENETWHVCARDAFDITLHRGSLVSIVMTNYSHATVSGMTPIETDYGEIAGLVFLGKIRNDCPNATFFLLDGKEAVLRSDPKLMIQPLGKISDYPDVKEISREILAELLIQAAAKITR